MDDRFDFSFLKHRSVDTAQVRVVDGDEPTEWYITIAGPEHASRKRMQFNRQRRLRAVLAKTGKVPVLDPEEDEADELETLIACTLGWSGAPVDYCREAVQQLYTDPAYRFVRDQVATALQERELFTRPCAPR